MNFIKKKGIYGLAFLIPVIILSIVYINHNCFFFQEKSILVGDAKEQYISLLSYLKDVFNGKQSLFYSFSKGLGGGMLGTFSYYLASPINIFLLFINKINLENFILFSVLFKCGLSGLMMYSYLKNNTSNNQFILLLSTCYALNSYFVNYYFNIMWLDALWLLPLIMIGIDKIVNANSSLMYFLVLTLAIFSNYYIGYMLCIFSVIYFYYKLLIKYNLKNDFKIIKKLSINFFVSSLFSGLLLAFLLIPTIIELKSTRNSMLSFQEVSFLSPITLISKLFVGTNIMTDAFSKENLHIYCGMFVVILICFYIKNSDISKKEKRIDLITLCIFLLSILIPYIGYIWHAFSIPNGYNYRFSFIFVTYLIILASKNISYLDKIKFNDYFKTFIFFMVIIIVLVIYNKIDIIGVFSSIMFITLILFCLFKYFSSLKRRNIFLIILFLVIFSELFFNSFLSYGVYFANYKNDFKEHLKNECLVSEYKATDDEFYRIHIDDNFSSIDSFMLDYYGVSSFLSTNYKNILDFADNVGIRKLKLGYLYDDSNSSIIDSILGIKYIFSSNKINKNYEKMETSFNDIGVYLNNNALSLGYLVDSKNVNYTTNSFLNQSNLLNSMINDEQEYFQKINYEYKYNKYFVNNKNKNIYFEFMTIKEGKIKILIDGIEIFNDTVFSKYTGSFKTENIGSTIEIISDEEIISNINFYILNENNVLKALKKLKENELMIEKNNNYYINGKIKVLDNEKFLFLSIPYDENWQILVDGKHTDYFEIYGAFIGLEISEGEHVIELKYRSNGLIIGTIISGISFCLSIVYFVMRRKFI